MTTSASFQELGKWLCRMHWLYRPCIKSLTCSQQALSSLTVTLSVPGEVLVTPIVFRSTSSRDKVLSHSRCPVPSQLWRGSSSAPNVLSRPTKRLFLGNG